ncbi:MAG: glycosyltransferase family 4 protein [Planctomycetes bacterium]|nr:glycosyltransferase family 4 protein [Planctomycetota bacterium]
MKILQICNVGQIVGGTAACAWTLSRSLPNCQHHVVFLSSISEETGPAFSGCRVEQWNEVTASAVKSVNPDVVILHNISCRRVEKRLPAVTIEYLHSKISPALADLTLFCSDWLAQLYGADSHNVCWQAVPRPKRLNGAGETRSLRTDPVIGRICTPQHRKWPDGTVAFYAGLANRFPNVQWEFVGCPRKLQRSLRDACDGKAGFFSASWSVRSRLWHWDAMLYHHPTLTESFGRTVAESMRAGCVPIVDDRGGFREQVQEGCGFLCKKEIEFSDAVEQLMSPAHRWRISRACRVHADEHFSLARFGKEIIRRIREAAGNHRDAGVCG